jgi:hypothetical protein
MQFTNKNTHILRTDILQKQCGRGAFVYWGQKTRAGDPRKFLNFESLKCPFPGLWGSFDRTLMVRKKRFIVCQNLQFAYNL